MPLPHWANRNGVRQGFPNRRRQALLAGRGHPQALDGLCSRRRDCHFDDTPFLSLLKHLIKVEGVQQNDSLADGQACSGWIASGGSRRMRGLAWQ